MHLPWNVIFFDVTYIGLVETANLRNGVELATSVSDKHLDLLSPFVRSFQFLGVMTVSEIDDMSIYIGCDF